MPSDRTLVTELATALGMLGNDELSSVLAERSRVLVNLGRDDWQRLTDLWQMGDYEPEFLAGFLNGRTFFRASDALRNRHPQSIEWTGGRQAPGDEVVPSDLRIDHVYLVSCKYLSRILHNSSPAHLVERLLTRTPVQDARDWYQRVAPDEYQQLYLACVSGVAEVRLPEQAADLSVPQRRHLAEALRGKWPVGAADAYAELCSAVAERTAAAWRAGINKRNAEAVLWRLLRIGSAPYFILGTSPSGSMRLRIDTPWDWRQAYRLRRFDVASQPAGQPRMKWSAEYEVRRTSEERTVCGHVEIRWSHGRFAQPPEAKVYLDTAHEDVPGYHPL
jgi:hypothetical protein